MKTHDVNGREVEVGDAVRVLSIRSSVLDRLDADERIRVAGMQGLVLSVYEIDDWGGAWVSKAWATGEGMSATHSLSLSPKEMEKVGN